MDKYTKDEASNAIRQSLMPPPPYCRKGDKTGSDSARQSLTQLRLEVSDAGELMHLCEKLTDATTCALEGKINKYVSSFLND